MGSNISSPATTRTIGALDSYVSDLGANIAYEKSLGAGRFLKTVKGRHKNGPVVIKIFVKPDPGISLRNYRRRLKIERESLAGIPNVYSHQTFFETDVAGYILRQWVSSSLYDRLSTRPFLSIIEKKWIAFQVLTGMKAATEQRVPHGDIKSENILVTSWNWVYITDFGSIKPVFLPEDDPTDYSFYFDTSGRRTCYIAPERFYSAESEISIKRRSETESSEQPGSREGKIKEAMDVFSAGCVIAEMFLEGITFTLSQLYKYRSGDLDMGPRLEKGIKDEGIRGMIMSMIALDPKERPTFAEVLADAQGKIFPDTFYNFMHNYIASVNHLSHPLTSPASPFSKVALPETEPIPGNQQAQQQQLSIPSDPKLLPNDSDARMERIWEDFAELEASLVEDVEDTITELKLTQTNSTGKPFQDIVPVELAIPDRTSKLRGGVISGQKAAAQDGCALIIVSMVTSNIRNCTLPSSKVKALDLLLALSCHLTDEAKLDRLVPYVVDVLHDEAPSVRGAAIRTLVQVLALVSTITPANAAIFPEYILPNIRHLSRDIDVSVRCLYAQCISTIADCGVGYLERTQALKTHGTFKVSDEYDDGYISYDASLVELRTLIQEQVVSLLFDPSSVVKRATLLNITNLCVFFGRQITNDVLLSHMITYLNDRDWQLRWAFFNSIVGVATYLGKKSLEEYILPLMIQALSDVEETVVAKVLSALTNLSDLSLFSKMRMWELMSATVGFLYHPNIWIRQGAAAFLASAAKKLPSTDVWCILYPALQKQLRSDVRAITESSLLSTVKPPLSRPIFDAALSWAMKADRSLYWNGPAPRSSRLESDKGTVRTSGMSTPSKRNLTLSEEDALQMGKLRQLGMETTDDDKLVALRDYIVKLANATLSFQQRDRGSAIPNPLTDGKDVELLKLGVTPHTVFLGPKDPKALKAETPNRNSLAVPRTPILGGTPRMSRLNSIDSSKDGAAVEDLRRKLVQLDGSTHSLNSTSTGGYRSLGIRRESLTSVTSPLPSPIPSETASHRLSSNLDGTGSPSESVLSGGIDVLRRRHQKAAVPVVGAVNTNIAGVLEAPKLRTAEEEALTSGRTSPNSVAGTVRGQHRPSSRRSSVQPTAYDGQDPGIDNLLDTIYQDQFRDPTTDFGPRVHVGPVRKRNTVRSSFTPRDANARRQDVTLIAHLTGHDRAVNEIVVAPDHAFFVSCSDDKTVKVWDSARLERNVTSKPRQTYTQHHAPVTCLCMLEASYCFASAATDGSLHVVRVQFSQQTSSPPKYKPLQVIREHRVDRMGEYISCMTHYNAETTSNLVYATTLSTVVILDLRTMRILQSMEDSRQHGPITCMGIDKKRAWLLTGTLYGVLTLWDLRFGLRLKSWTVAAAASVSSGEVVRIHQVAIHPTKGKGRWVVVAVQPQTTNDLSSSSVSGMVTLVEVWDVEKGVIVETFATLQAGWATNTTSPPSEVVSSLQEYGAPTITAKDAPRTPAEAIAALVKARNEDKSKSMARPIDEESPHLAEADLEAEERRRATQVGVRAMVLGPDFGGLAASGARLGRMDGPDGFYHATIPEEGPTGTKGGFMLTGSEDRKIRLWDLGRLDRSMVVSGLELENDRPSFRTIQAPEPSLSSIHTEAHNRQNAKNEKPAWRTSLIGHHQQQLLKGHQDCITALACIDVPFRCGIISGDRSGVIKVFRMEYELV